MNSERNIAVVGLGYVGLPLAVALSKNFPVIGYDRDSKGLRSFVRDLIEPMSSNGKP